MQRKIADWLGKCGLTLRESSEGENGDDQCLKLLPQKRLSMVRYTTDTATEI